MLNYAPHASIEDVLPLPSGAAMPILAGALEYDRALPEAAEQSFLACIRALDHQPELPRPRDDELPSLIKDFVRYICTDGQIPQIYAGHAAADAAYLKDLLG